MRSLLLNVISSEFRSLAAQEIFIIGNEPSAIMSQWDETPSLAHSSYHFYRGGDRSICSQHYGLVPERNRRVYINANTAWGK